MIIPSLSDIKILEKAAHDAGYYHYSITKKPSAMKSYSKKFLAPNPYLLVKNQQTNRILQVQWSGDIKVAVKSTIAQIEEYESKIHSPRTEFNLS